MKNMKGVIKKLIILAPHFATAILDNDTRKVILDEDFLSFFCWLNKDEYYTNIPITGGSNSSEYIGTIKIDLDRPFKYQNEYILWDTMQK
jgi:hypothetical protein